jgi:short-subunit dehydrogenase
MSLTKKSVVVITGAASGIGRALAVRLSKEPIAGIAIADVNEVALAETKEMAERSGVKVTAHRVDVANENEMGSFANEVIRSHGRVTHVINNAGVALGGTVREVTLDDIHWLIGINFWGVVHRTKIFLPYLEKEPSAHIVNISSIFGIIAPPGQAAYCASKFAVRGFTESLRHELASSNVAVTVVHPGGVGTNIANNARIGDGVSLTEDEIREKRKRINKNLARSTPDEAAETIVCGIKARRPRIMIGSDARILGIVQRLFPRRYFSVLDRLSGGRIKET